MGIARCLFDVLATSLTSVARLGYDAFSARLHATTTAPGATAVGAPFRELAVFRAVVGVASFCLS